MTLPFSAAWKLLNGSTVARQVPSPLKMGTASACKSLQLVARRLYNRFTRIKGLEENVNSATGAFRILIVEDNPSDVFLIQYALGEHELKAEYVVLTDGDQCLTYLDGLTGDPAAATPDLILLDLHVPKRDSAEIMQYINAHDSLTRIPVIALSSSVLLQDKHDAEKRGAVHYFRKAPSLDEFVELGGIIKKVLGVSSGNPRSLSAEQP
jgi:CheY-like chemotaxis protein